MPVMIFGAIALPLYVKNVFLAVTNCSLRTIMLSCLCTGFPFAIMWTFLGSKAKGVVEILNGQTPELGAPLVDVLCPSCASFACPHFCCKVCAAAWKKAVEEIKLQDENTKDS